MKKHHLYLFDAVKMVKLLLGTDKTKYFYLIMKLMKTHLSYSDELEYVNRTLKRYLTSEEVDDLSDIQKILFYSMMRNEFLFKEMEDIEIYKRFVKLNERGLIEQNDVTKYKNFNEITSEVSKAELKLVEKETETEIVTILRDENYFILKPLSYDSSKKYGAGTKWCTTQIKSFEEYTLAGCLIYIIDLKKGKKFGLYKNLNGDFTFPKDISFWDEKDNRIDSMFLGLNEDVMSFLTKYILNETETNNQCFAKLFKDPSDHLDNPSETKVLYSHEDGSVLFDNPISVTENLSTSSNELTKKIKKRGRKPKMISEVLVPHVSDDFQIGPDGAHEYNHDKMGGRLGC